jgi:hypothetical protein
MDDDAYPAKNMPPRNPHQPADMSADVGECSVATVIQLNTRRGTDHLVALR